MPTPVASIIRILGITAAALLLLAAAMYLLYAHAAPLTERIFEDNPPTIEGFINVVSNPPVCYYEGISERTEKPHSTRDWAYTFLLGDCHPQNHSLGRILIDAVIPHNPRYAGSTPHQPRAIHVQYAQDLTAETPTHSTQEIAE